MIEKSAETRRKIAIGGIKFSQELVHVRLTAKKLKDTSFTELLQLIAQIHINIPFISHSATSESDTVSFCIDNEDLDQVQSILRSATFQCSPVQIIKGVGTLTIFPHKNSFLLLGNVVSVFGKYQFPLYSLCTSISTIAFNTDYIHLDHVAEQLATITELPDNHAPFRQQFCLKQMD
jgi:aspartokinase